jgi:hypothetical protein
MTLNVFDRVRFAKSEPTKGGGGTDTPKMPSGDGPGGRGQMPVGDDRPAPMPDGDGPGGKKRR